MCGLPLAAVTLCGVGLLCAALLMLSCLLLASITLAHFLRQCCHKHTLRKDIG